MRTEKTRIPRLDTVFIPGKLGERLSAKLPCLWTRVRLRAVICFERAVLHDDSFAPHRSSLKGSHSLAPIITISPHPPRPGIPADTCPEDVRTACALLGVRTESAV
jgi:hypothetical protein